MSKYPEMPIQLGEIRSSTHIVAWRNEKPVRRVELFLRVDAWRRLLKNTVEINFALYINDSLEFTGALLGALQAGKKVYLPSDALPATCISLSHSVDGYLGDFPAAWSPLTPDEIEIGEHFEADILTVPHRAEVVVHTSGSTGEAQAIPKSFSQLLTEVATLEKLFGRLCETADVVSTVSHQHIYGLLFKVLWPLVAGRPMHIRNFSFPEELVAATSARDAILVTSPAHLKRFPDSSAWIDATHCIRVIFSSGGPLDAKIAQEIGRLIGQIPIEIYGSSETGGIAWRRRHLPSDDSWSPMPKVEWRIDARDSELEIRSDYLPDSNWFRMADRVIAVDENRFLLLGRTDRIVKIEEKRVSLDAIEKQLTSSHLVSEARVLLVETGKTGRQRIAAFVVPTAYGQKMLAETGRLGLNRRLRLALISSFERIALPKVWRYLDQLPVNSLGKTTYAELTATLDTTMPTNAHFRPKFPNQRLLEQSAQRVLVELVIPENLFYFEGHFPSAPILPGVVQVDWAIYYGRRYLDLPASFRGIHALKFQQVISPGVSVTLELQYDISRSRLVFRYFSQKVQHASGQILLGDPRV